MLRSSSPVRDLSKGAVTSQAGFLNLKIVKIMWTFHVKNDKNVIYMFNSYICCIVYAK